MAHRHTPTLRRLAWERLWRILLAPPTEVEQARLQHLRDHSVKMINTTRRATMATSTHSNAAIYCRVSTRQQAEDGSSLDSQEVACRRLAASQGFTVTQVFKEDFPGTELARPLLDQLRSWREVRRLRRGLLLRHRPAQSLARAPGAHRRGVPEVRGGARVRHRAAGLVTRGPAADLRARLGGPARAREDQGPHRSRQSRRIAPAGCPRAPAARAPRTAIATTKPPAAAPSNPPKRS